MLGIKKVDKFDTSILKAGLQIRLEFDSFKGNVIIEGCDDDYLSYYLYLEDEVIYNSINIEQFINLNGSIKILSEVSSDSPSLGSLVYATKRVEGLITGVHIGFLTYVDVEDYGVDLLSPNGDIVTLYLSKNEYSFEVLTTKEGK